MQTQGQGNGRGQQGRPDIEAKPKQGEELIKQLLAERKREIMALFAKDENPEASYVRAVGLCVGAYRKVQADSRDRIDEYSVIATGLWAIQRKLDPGTDVYFVPYKGKVTPIVSPQGVIKLAFRSGFVLSVEARAVFEGEQFEYALGSECWIRHKKANARPRSAREAWEKLTHVYCVVHLKGGGRPQEVLDRADIEYHRSLSPTGTYDSSMWGKFPAEAARKTVLKQALKFVPQESEISEILANDDTEKGIEIPDEIWDAVQRRQGAAAGKAEVAPAGNGEGRPVRGGRGKPEAAAPQDDGRGSAAEEEEHVHETAGGAAEREPGVD